MGNILRKMMCSILVASVLCANFTSINSYADFSNNIEITLGSNNIYLYEASKVSISFKESLNQQNITLVQECAGEELNTELSFNSETNAYEGIINYNIQPEAIDIWSIDRIIVGDEVITKEQLRSMGLNLESYEVKQNYYLNNISGVNYSPKTRSDKYSKYTVVLDPGHGGTSGSNWGGTTIVNDSLWEKDYNIDTTLSTANYLSSLGVNVILTRDKDVYVALQDRTNFINRKSPDFAVSIHYNGEKPHINGTSAYYRYADRNGGLSKSLAGNIVDSIINKFNFNREGIKYRTYVDSKTNRTLDYYHMIRESKVPTVLVECCYASNVNDQAKVNTKQKRQIMGEEIGKGIIKTLDDMSGEVGGSTDEEVKKVGTASANVNVRKGPSTNYQSVGQLKKGQKVDVVAINKGTGWYKIKYNNAYAYVSNQYLVVRDEEEDNSGGGGGNPGGGDTGGGTGEDNSGGSTGGETTVKTGTATANLNVRKGPSTSNTSIGVLKKGQKVEVVGTDSSSGWYKIKYNGGYGYVSNQYVKLDSSNGGSTGGGETSTKTGTATANLNVRKGPSTNNTSIGVLKKGQKVEVVGTDSGTGWYKIKYNGGYGYVSNKYLSVNSSGGSGGSTGGETIVKTGTATANLNVRKGPSTSNASIGVLKKGQKVEVVGKDSATGWYKIKYNGGYGFVSNKYLTVK